MNNLSILAELDNIIWYVYRQKICSSDLIYSGQGLGLYPAIKIVELYTEKGDIYKVECNKECDKVTINSKDCIFFIQTKAEDKKQEKIGEINKRTWSNI